MHIPPTQLKVEGARLNVTLCQCLRCGHLWKPRQSEGILHKRPSKCSGCFSPDWDKLPIYKKNGVENTGEKAKPRGKPFQAGIDERRGDRKVTDPNPLKVIG